MNSVRELSCHMNGATPAHLKAMHRVMRYTLGTKDKGLFLKPSRVWDNDPDFEHEIMGLADAAFAKTEQRHSITGYSVHLNDAPIREKSKAQTSVTVSTSESEVVSGTDCAQEMLQALHIIMEGMGFKVKKPMILKIDNKGAVDFANSWNVTGRTRHVEVKYYFLRELKERGLNHVQWISNEDMDANLFTKNCGGPEFFKQATKYVN